MNMMNVGRAKWVCLGLVVWMVWIGGGVWLAEAGRLYEINYVARFCIAEGGVLEETLPDRSRPDCSTKTHVIEAYFGDKASDNFTKDNIKQVKRHMDNDPYKREGGILLILENDNKGDIRTLCDVMEEMKVSADISDIWIMDSDFTYQSYSCNGGKFGPPKRLDYSVRVLRACPVTGNR